MFKFAVLASALLLSVSALPAEVSSGSGFLSSLREAMSSKAGEVKSTIKQTASDSVGLMHNIVHSTADTAMDSLQFGKDIVNSGINGGVAIAMETTGKVANISSTGLDILNNMMKPIPGVKHVAKVATDLGKGGLAFGTNVAMTGLDAAGRGSNTAVNTAASVATNTLSVVDKASGLGTGLVQKFWNWV